MNNLLCPICHLPECKGYPLMWERYAAGRDRAHWRRIHDRLNGLVASVASLAVTGIPIADSIRATRLGFQRCWFSTKADSCGCSGVRCHLLKRIVSLRDCVSCLDH